MGKHDAFHPAAPETKKAHGRQVNVQTELSSPPVSTQLLQQSEFPLFSQLLNSWVLTSTSTYIQRLVAVLGMEGKTRLIRYIEISIFDVRCSIYRGVETRCFDLWKLSIVRYPRYIQISIFDVRYFDVSTRSMRCIESTTFDV